ncbi:MAG: hypothetical protein GWP08_13265 [Nitrospiraceae bacterium]|nr:hypothetical protein [Nitrospiraceae bacterium]
MRHVKTISRTSTPAVGATTGVEQLILLILGVFFRDWDNGPQVIQNLTSFYSKT